MKNLSEFIVVFLSTALIGTLLFYSTFADEATTQTYAFSALLILLVIFSVIWIIQFLKDMNDHNKGNMS